ncbi:MAG: NUDIX domain-containing protein [Clostridia bacterium]|nr:NUDIX domain-containing protein [Clostridia bacterium]
MGYYMQKAKRVKKLYDKGLPFVKVYAAVRDGDGFLVLKKTKGNEVVYDIAGGGVDKGESLEKALKRELKEEMRVEVDVIKELGVYDKMYREWEYKGEKFSIQYEIHVFDTRLIKRKRGKLGLKGEFDKQTEIVKIDKETLVSSVAEFRDFGIKID